MPEKGFHSQICSSCGLRLRCVVRHSLYPANEEGRAIIEGYERIARQRIEDMELLLSIQDEVPPSPDSTR